MTVQSTKSPFIRKKIAEHRKKSEKKAKAEVEKVAASLEGKSLNSKKPGKKQSEKVEQKPAGKQARSKSEERRIAAQTKIADDGEIIDGDDEPEETGSMTQSQAKVVAELAGIVLRQGQRVFALKLNSSVMIKDLTRIWNEQRSFMMGFKVPVEKKGGEVTKWKVVEFPTKLIDLSLKGKDSATCHGHIDHAGACAMSELILNWKGGVEFMLDGVQQSMF